MHLLCFIINTFDQHKYVAISIMITCKKEGLTLEKIKYTNICWTRFAAAFRLRGPSSTIPLQNPSDWDLLWNGHTLVTSTEPCS